MLNHLGHVERDDEAALEIVAKEERGDDVDLVRADELFNEPHQLSQQERPITLPGPLHLVVHLTRGLEDDPLRAELPRQLL